jgi:hypothetical protein
LGFWAFGKGVADGVAERNPPFGSQPGVGVGLTVGLKVGVGVGVVKPPMANSLGVAEGVACPAKGAVVGLDEGKGVLVDGASFLTSAVGEGIKATSFLASWVRLNRKTAKGIITKRKTKNPIR